MPIIAFSPDKVNMSVVSYSRLMATSSTTTDGEAASIGPCKNAEQFALKRLGNAEEPKRPSQLAEEYGCSNSRMRDALGNLRETGAVTRVARGEYASTSGYQQDEDSNESVDVDGGESPDNDSEEVTESGLSEYASDSRDSAGESESAELEQMVQRQREVFGRSGNEPEGEIEAEEGTGGASIPKSLVIGVAVLLAVIVLFQIIRSRGGGGEAASEQERRGDGLIGV